MMSKLTIGLGAVLIALGLAAYFGAGRTSMTALIPAFFGLPMLLLGLIALRAGARKHAMHAAAALALVGLLGTVGGVPRLITLLAGGDVARPVAAVVQGVMALLCAVFLLLAIRSFVQARRGGGELP